MLNLVVASRFAVGSDRVDEFVGCGCGHEDGDAVAAFELVGLVGFERAVSAADGENGRARRPRDVGDATTDWRFGCCEVEVDDAIAA